MLQKVFHKNDLFQAAEEMQFGDIHIKTDPSTGLRAIIAIHNTNLGPALGGCRCVRYDSTEAAIYDAMRLAQGMSYKAALADVPQGGGKSVLMKPDHIENREAYLESFGEFVETLGGRYITAVDSGTNVSDMDIIARKTSHVVSTSAQSGGKGDPSPFTALGVLRGIQAAVAHKLKKDSLAGVHVAIQGAGNVARYLCEHLVKLDAKLTICDSKPDTAAQFANDFGASVVDKESIFDVECDVFAPCARGGVLSESTVKRLKAVIVAGAANNQLAQADVAELLFNKNILYAPDYVINAGGLIHVSLESMDVIRQKVDGIYDALIKIFQRSDDQHLSSSIVADSLAREIIARAV